MFENREKFFRWGPCLLFVMALSLTFGAAMQLVPSDPGPRGGAPGAGGPIAGYSVKESKFFDAGLDAFSEKQSVRGTLGNTELGLGPRFNLDSCIGCHAHPAAGGTSPALNPQVAVATKDGATNTVPSFIKLNGPIMEARFKFVDPPANRIRDGGVHDLYTITGRTDAAGCNIAQPDFVTAAAQNNLIFRIPTPLFGAGLIEAIPDSTILEKETNPPAGISGHANREGNAGTVSRFGWKAQNKSLMIFSGEAYNVEQGVTNELFQQERDETPGCVLNPLPENHTNYEDTPPERLSGDVVNFTNFMRFLAPPTPVASYGSVSAISIERGKALFSSVGCSGCHRLSMKTGITSTGGPNLSQKDAYLFSDLLVHNMGSRLADDVVQGAAGPDEFRTAPLWGLGQRLFFLHDGRTSDLRMAIQAHSSPGSEANSVIDAFKALSDEQEQDILNFLRSL